MSAPSSTRVAALAAATLLLGGLPLVGSPAHAAKAASGTVPMSCTIEPFGNEFDYAARLKVTGKRQGKRLALVARLSPMPGVAPVPVNGDMESTLVLKVGSARATLTGSSEVSVGASASIPVSSLTGTTKAPRKAERPRKLRVSVVSYAFELPSYGVSGACAPTGAASLGTLKIR